MSQATALEGRQISWPGAVTLGLGSVMAVTFIAAFAVPYLMFSNEALARFAGREAWIFAHVFGGTIALLVGPVQIWFGLKRRRLNLHRSLGYVYLATGGLGCLAAFYLASTTEISWVFGMGLGGLALSWVITTGLAFMAIKKRMIAQHQEWMIRSYVTTFGFVTFRLMVGILQATGVGTLVEQLTVASWFCWAVPLLITEAIIQGRKVLGSAQTRSA